MVGKKWKDKLLKIYYNYVVYKLSVENNLLKVNICSIILERKERKSYDYITHLNRTSVRMEREGYIYDSGAIKRSDY